jgi:hypothetical protein
MGLFAFTVDRLFGRNAEIFSRRFEWGKSYVGGYQLFYREWLWWPEDLPLWLWRWLLLCDVAKPVGAGIEVKGGVEDGSGSYEKIKREPDGFNFDEAALAAHEANYRKHIAIVDLPPYEDGLCALEVHFLTCNQVKVSTSCWGYPSPNTPIKEPLEMKEPAVCPK